MLQVLDLTQNNIIATRTNGLPAINDFGKIHPLIHNILTTGKKVRWYFEIDGDSNVNVAGGVEGSETEADYGKMNFIQSEDIERIAIVGAKKWEKSIEPFMKQFTKACKMYFDLSDRKKAIEWIMSLKEVIPVLQTGYKNQK